MDGKTAQSSAEHDSSEANLAKASQDEARTIDVFSENQNAPLPPCYDPSFLLQPYRIWKQEQDELRQRVDQLSSEVAALKTREATRLSEVALISTTPIDSETARRPAQSAEEAIILEEFVSDDQHRSQGSRNRRKIQWLGSYSKSTTISICSFVRTFLLVLGVTALIILCLVLWRICTPTTPESSSSKAPPNVEPALFGGISDSPTLPVIIRALSRVNDTLLTTTEPTILSLPNLTVSLRGSRCYEFSLFFVCRLKNRSCVISTVDFSLRKSIDVYEMAERPLILNPTENSVFNNLCDSKFYRLKE